MPDEAIKKAIRFRLLGRSPVGAYLRFNEWLWNMFPQSIINRQPLISYGHFIHKISSLYSDRRQYYGTFFMRNRSELKLMANLAHELNKNLLDIAVLGCSNGAEVYSILWMLRKTFSNLKVRMHAMDISEDVLAHAKKAVYSDESSDLVGTNIFERLTDSELNEMFEKKNDKLIIKPWIKKDIKWYLGDAADSALSNIIVPQDIVVANNFLCHMTPSRAEHCLKNISAILKSDGYIFVSGVDLDVRTSIAKELGWEPVTEFIDEIHDGDYVLRKDWPFKWWGLEPLNRKRKNWVLRYASVFKTA